MKPIRLLVVEDHTIVREGLMNILAGYSDICIVGEASNGNDMIEKYFEYNPDVVLSDVNMPGKDGTVAAREILDKRPDAKIIFLTMFKSEEYIFRCLKSGALGMVSKDVIKHELIFAIRKVFAGERYFMGKSNTELNMIKQKFINLKSDEETDKLNLLSNREKLILEMIGKGLKSSEIAEQLAVSKRTIDTSRMSITGKLGVTSLPQLIKYAVELSYKKKNDPEN